MTHAADVQHRFPLRRGVGLLVGLGLSVGAAAAAVLIATGRAEQLTVALSIGGVCLAMALVALVPMGVMAGKADERIVGGAMVGMMVRLFGTLGGVALLVLAAGLDVRPAAWWALGWYALFLAAEVLVMVNYLRPMQVNGHAENATC